MAKYADPIITKHSIIFDLHEPIYGTMFGIYKKWLVIARDRHLHLVVKTPFGTATYETYREWCEGAEIKKKPHNFNTPMLFYCRQVREDIEGRTQRKKKEKIGKVEQLSVFNTLANTPPEYFNKMKAIFK